LTTKAANDLQTQTKEEESTLVLHWSAICCTSLTMIYKLKTKEEEEETTLLLCQGASFAPH